MSQPCTYTGECTHGCKRNVCKLKDQELWNKTDHGDWLLAWTVLGEPQPKKRGRIVKLKTGYTIKKHPDTERAEQVFALLSNAYLPSEPITGPVEVSIRFVFEVTPSWPAWKRSAALAGRYLHTKKPDLDNLVKLVLDALNGLAWVDDTQVVAGKLVKAYGETARTDVEIRRLVQATA